jgi:hypothetical protein
MRKRIAALVIVLVLALPMPAMAHTKNASHDGCGVKHGLTYDGYSGGKYWYHTMTYQTAFVREQVAKHYYRGGPPSSPVYYYSHTTTWFCW